VEPPRPLPICTATATPGRCARGSSHRGPRVIESVRIGGADAYRKTDLGGRSAARRGGGIGANAPASRDVCLAAMHPARRTDSAARLLERDEELLAIDVAVRAALVGDGTVVVIEGPAGIGKTSLLNSARRRATAYGMTVIASHGAILESDFGFGVVRQLFEPVIAAASAAQRRRLLEGAAALAKPVVAAQDVESGAPPRHQTAIAHGLYWLTANIAEHSPVMIAVDDVHWADPPSLQFLTYLSRRLEGMTVLLVVVVRTGDRKVDDSLVAELVSGPAVHVIRPSPLSMRGVGEVVRERLGRAEAAFIEACRTATGGVPFLLQELVDVLEADGVTPTREAAVLIGRSGPRTVAQATTLRLGRLSPEAVAVARAVAVLGRQARVDRIAVLADVELETTRVAVDTLIAMDLLAPGHPVRFAHPLVHQAIYEDLHLTARAAAHARVARTLTEENAPLDEVAAHLLLSEPAGRDDVVEILRRAAHAALRRGAPQSAAAYLRRALAEGGRSAHLALLQELGRAEALAGDLRGIDHLREAISLADDPAVRVGITYELATLHALSGDWRSFADRIRDALAPAAELDLDLVPQLETARGAVEYFDPRTAYRFEERLPRLLGLIEAHGPAGRGLALHVAAVMTSRGMRRAEVLRLVWKGLDEGRYLREVGSESPVMAHAPGALISLDELDAAARVVDEMSDDAHRRGSVVGYAAASIYRAWISAQRGSLKDGEAHLRSAVDLAREHGLTFWLPSAFQCGVDILLERPSVDDMSQLAESLALPAGLAATISGAFVSAMRGRLRLARGRRMEAIVDLRSAGEIAIGARVSNPLWLLWRSPLALALQREHLDEAMELIEEELACARRSGLARCTGTALRASGCLQGGRRGIDLLEASLDALEKTQATLERARTLVELGAALRRSNHRVAAREPLYAGLDLADRCGAERLAARAEDELRASGARPRRRAMRGPDAMTASEGRVARMAARGMTNREIAQSLFVTAKTVENQLSAAYRKLGVGSRDELGSALASTPLT
jgi:DNA-binding CsgD family transcriptional regulator